MMITMEVECIGWENGILMIENNEKKLFKISEYNVHLKMMQ